MLIIGETGFKAYRNSLHYFCESKTVLKYFFKTSEKTYIRACSWCSINVTSFLLARENTQTFIHGFLYHLPLSGPAEDSGENGSHAIFSFIGCQE